MSNKKQLLKGHTVICAEVDADVIIAQTALQNTSTTLAIREETDHIILLIYNVKSEWIMF